MDPPHPPLHPVDLPNSSATIAFKSPPFARYHPCER